jgi:xanthine/uracil permease
MKHLLLVLVLLVVGYGVWHFVPKTERDEGVRLISRHGIRLGALVAVALALVAFAYYASSTRIL